MSLNWDLCVQQLLEKTPNEITDHDYVYYNQRWDNFVLNEDPFKVCLYTNPKGKLQKLYKEYYNVNAWSKLKDKERVNISMIGAPKVGTNAKQKHCIIYLEVNHTEKNVLIHFRNSDFFKKFLVDVYFIKDIMKEYGLKDYTISIEFEKLTLRLPFAYIYLNYVYTKTLNQEKVKELMRENIFEDFVKYYKKHGDKISTWKSLERCARYMKETKVYPIIKNDMEKSL